MKHRNKAAKKPSQYMSVIIDGMDQDKTNIPHITSNPKALAGQYTLETHVTGVKLHGRESLMFIDYNQFPHDTNLTIELLLTAFLRHKVHIPVKVIKRATFVQRSLLYYCPISYKLISLCFKKKKHKLQNTRKICPLCFIFKWITLVGTTRTSSL